MGVPKFFRWMSERYPAISQLIAENRIPEFDCLYLDMNGIIHNCTHKDSDSPTHRMTEEQMFIQIFNYIEHLFGKIQPKKLFFMAIDGVAPRAKMNQQRARRFRTALDAERAKERAIKSGVEMPQQEAFDSNCITPGTDFMAKLTRQLKYFVNKKISEDVAWQGCEVVLSGHEVPGEGEHKIMEYIRLAKAQPNYDANLRHCLYGLDADLIMLGLLSHDPHFCLLREEVTFGRSSAKKSTELEHQKFYLMHLCIVREYLELEFQELRDPEALEFKFDMERVIDDFILMAFFVGNDFLPNLPNLHINEGALALMFKIYKSVLPKAGGYINERGVINLERLGILLDEISQVEYRFFEAENADASWFKGKQMAKVDVMDQSSTPIANGPLTISTNQQKLYQQIKQFACSSPVHDQAESNRLDLSTSLNAADRAFVRDLAAQLHLQIFTVEDLEGRRHFRLILPPSLSDDEDGEDEEASLALLRVIKKYNNAEVRDVTVAESKAQLEKKYQDKFQGWKNKYYKEKFGWKLDDTNELRRLAENYVQGLQWVLYYYYQGVASWPWYYAYHYSPMISDVRAGLGANMQFTLGQPFRPYQQLMGVLPDRSKSIVPSVYHDLMTQIDSPIIDFYPREFELDMNGKKMEWEAVVKIPFIDESRLLKAMAPRDHLLTPEQAARNEFGVSIKFTYSPHANFIYPSSLVGIFPDLTNCHCVENTFDLPTVEGLEYHVGLMKGVQVGKSALYGFPSLQNLPFHGKLDFHGVSVFQQESRNESMVVNLLDTEGRETSKCAQDLLGTRVHVGYPFLTESKVIAISDGMFRYTLADDSKKAPIATPHGPRELEAFQRKTQQIETTYSKRLGIIIGDIESLIHVDVLKGLRKTDEGALVKEFGQIPGIETDYASQIVVKEVLHEDQRFVERKALPLTEEYPLGSRAFFLGEFNYGRPAEVCGHSDNKADIWVSCGVAKIPEFGRRIVGDSERLVPYSPAFVVAKSLGLNPLVLSKITSAFQVMRDDTRMDLGLNLKFEAKKLKVLGYSRRGDTGWEFSQKAIDLIKEYMIKFPEFIAGIQRGSHASMYTVSDFYQGPGAKDKISEISAWLKSAQTKNFEKVPLEAEQLDSAIVQQIEEGTNLLAQTEMSAQGANKKINAAPRNALLKPQDAEQRLAGQRFSLGDRVVYVQDSGRVPIATRGVVVGKTQTARTTLLDIIFEVTFMSGTSLENRCSPFRGSTVPCHSVLNLTDKQLIAGAQHGTKVHETSTNKSEKSRSTGHGHGHGILGQEQLRPAAAPPRLRDSFRTAAAAANSPNTHSRGSPRGRGLRGTGISQQHHQSLPIRGGRPPPRGSSTPQADSTIKHLPPRGRGQARGGRVAPRVSGPGRGNRGGGAAKQVGPSVHPAIST